MRARSTIADCQAAYRSATAPCRAANVTLGAGIPRHAAASGSTLGLDPSVLRALQARYPLDNLYEAGWLALVPQVARLIALGVTLGLGLAPWTRWHLRPLAAVAAGLLTFSAVDVAFGGLLVRTGLVD